MEIQNYYLLLDLPIDPPENNPKTIQETIEKKQVEWSRLRNHPTKGTLAQKYIGMIPEIKRVMLDEGRRKQEAENARKIIARQEEEKNAQIDRHLLLLNSKGGVHPGEIDGIAKHHGVTPKHIEKRLIKKRKAFAANLKIEALIQSGKTDQKQLDKVAKQFSIKPQLVVKWIQNKERETSQEIENYLKRCKLRGGGGYITSDEISSLSELFGVPEERIQTMVRYPIKKKGDPKADKPNPIDKTIEKLINDKLAIVGKASLYDFLELPPLTDIETLQRRSREREVEIRKIGQKDAATTAMGALAGHCMAMFKTDETRKAYDISLTLSRLGELNADIDVAGISGKIHPAYLKLLIRAALGLGMDIGEAREYIEGYCRAKGWPIQKVKKAEGRKRSALFWGIAAGIAIAVMAGGFFFYMQLRERRIETAFQNAVTQAENNTDLERKVDILKGFVDEYPSSRFAQHAEEKIQSYQKRIVERDDFAKAETEAAAAEKSDLETALAAYRKHLSLYPESHLKEAAQQKMEVLTRRLEAKDYAAIENIPDNELDRRIEAYQRYLKRHPNGRHVPKVKELLSAVVGKYFDSLKDQLKQCERQAEYEKCANLCDRFIASFDGTEEAEKAKGMRIRFQNKIRGEKELADMKQMAEERGTDYEAARQIFIEYVEANPELHSYMREIIKTEIEKYDRLIAIQNQAEKDWETVYAFSRNPQFPLADRLQKVSRYVQQYPASPHILDAKTILEQLQKEKAFEDERLRAERETREWNALLDYGKNGRIPVTDRIAKAERYVQENRDGKFTPKARQLLAQLLRLKQSEDERLKYERAIQQQKQQELSRIKTVIRNSGGRFTENGNGTVTDQKTRLTWCMFDSYLETNQCLNFQDAEKYVQNLATGGYRDWRLPKAAELDTLLSPSPAFPSTKANWLWTSDVFWHGWNKMTQVYAPGNGNSWRRQAIAVEECGAVLGVRP